MVNKNVISTKKHEDREFAAKTSFEVTSVDIETPQTMVLLLASKEEMILLKALSSLDKYAGKMQQNAKVLYEEGILKLLLPLLQHSNVYIQRFTSKLLAELCFLESVVEALLEDEPLFLNVMEILHSVNDAVVKEFCASIIAELTKTTIGHEYLLNTNMIHILIPLLSLTDPDIQYNCLKIILNLINDPYEKTVLTNDLSFSIKPFINLLMSDYVAIQNITLDILNLLTQQTQGSSVPKQFQDAGGVAKLLAIIKNYEWKDIHGKSLDVLSNIYNDPKIAQNFLKDGVMQLFNYIDFAVDPQLIRRALEVLIKIAETPLGRKVLTDGGYIARLEAMLQKNDAGVCMAVCHLVANLCQDPGALRQILDLPIVQNLLDIVSDVGRDWGARSMAVNALYHILKRDFETCKFVASCPEKEFIQSIINQYNEGPPLQAAATAVNCVTVLAGYSDIKEEIIKENLISSLLHCFKDFEEDTAVLKLAACEALCSLLSEPQTREYLFSLNGLPIVWASVIKHPNNAQFLQSVATFVHLCVTNDKRFTPVLLQLDVLNWLLSQRSLRSECPAWEVALESVFNHFLPIKFAFTGRLEVTDVTENNFYITKVPMTREELNNNMFPIFDDLVSVKACPLRTLYLANFIEDDMADSKSLSMARGSFMSKASKMTRKDLLMMRSSFSFKKIRHQDHYLTEYLDSLRALLRQNGLSSDPSELRDHSVIDEDTIRGKTRIIGQFVANQMSGMEQNETCSSHMFQLHLNELRVELCNNIIPLGCMRVGLHLERAVLFKVLADKVGLPCSLVRGSGPHQRAWVEVSLPSLPPPPRPAYPDSLLRPNHVVDLMDDPGALLPLHSYEADKYCGLL